MNNGNCVVRDSSVQSFFCEPAKRFKLYKEVLFSRRLTSKVFLKRHIEHESLTCMYTQTVPQSPISLVW